jgi:hypothetical protein
VRIRIRNRSLPITNTDRIWSEYGSVADKYFVRSLVDNKVKLACKFFYIYEYIFTIGLQLVKALCLYII